MATSCRSRSQHERGGHDDEPAAVPLAPGPHEGRRQEQDRHRRAGGGEEQDTSTGGDIGPPVLAGQHRPRRHAHQCPDRVHEHRRVLQRGGRHQHDERAEREPDGCRRDPTGRPAVGERGEQRGDHRGDDRAPGGDLFGRHPVQGRGQEPGEQDEVAGVAAEDRLDRPGVEDVLVQQEPVLGPQRVPARVAPLAQQRQHHGGREQRHPDGGADRAAGLDLLGPLARGHGGRCCQTRARTRAGGAPQVATIRACCAPTSWGGTPRSIVSRGVSTGWRGARAACSPSWATPAPGSHGCCRPPGTRRRPHGCAVLSGRAVPSTSPSAYRPLREAFLAAFRAAPLPDDPSLAGFEGHLGQLVPSASAPAAEESPVLLAEAVVRLLAVLAGDTRLRVAPRGPPLGRSRDRRRPRLPRRRPPGEPCPVRRHDAPRRRGP